MSLPFNDAFNRTDVAQGGDLGNGFINPGSYRLQSGKLISGSGGPTNLVTRDVEADRLINSVVEVLINGDFSPLVASRVVGNLQRGYSAFVFENKVYFNFYLNGGYNQAAAGGIVTISRAYANAFYLLRFTTIQLDANSTKLKLQIFDPADLITPLDTAEATDTTAEMQNIAGGFGFGDFGAGLSADSVGYKAYIVGGPFTANPVITRGHCYRSEISASLATNAEGGLPPYTGQWYLSTTPGTLGAAIAGATGTSVTKTGLLPGTTYGLTYRVTDSTTPTAQTIDSAQLVVTTVKTRAAGGYVVAFEGDSITKGFSFEEYPGVESFADTMRMAGYSLEVINHGNPGAPIPNDIPNNLSDYPGYGVNVVAIMWGMNNAFRFNTSKATYKASLISYLASIRSNYPNVEKIILNHCTYSRSGGYDDAASLNAAQVNALLVSYNEAMDEVVAADTTGKLALGDTGISAYQQAHLSDIEQGGVHLTQAGQLHLGQFWATAAQPILPLAPDTTPPLLSSLTLRADGLHIDIVTNEDTTGTDGLAFTVGGTARTAPVTRTDARNLVAALASVAYGTDVVRAAYSQTGNLLDTAGNEVAAFSNVAVTNNSTQTAPPPASTITGVSITAPTAKTVYPGGWASFVATVAGTGSFNPARTWSKANPAAPVTLKPLPDGSVDALIAENAAPGSYQVQATSVQDNTKTATATITVQAIPVGGGGSRPTWQLGQVEFTFNMIESCRRLDADGDEPVRIRVTPALLDGTQITTTDFDPEISVSGQYDANDWKAATWAPGNRAALPVTGGAPGALDRGTYVVNIRLKSADGTVLRSDSMGLISIT